ncbi:MAG: hypothetical protein IT371_18405 [Deltaproteobacteria bacterium]|nr:hypothetical protein [Deltaproteobacteria bacterium]
MNEPGNGGPPREVEDEEQGEPLPPITLDRHLHRRRGSRVAWAQLFTLLMMLVALVLLVVYKERCTQMVTDFVTTMSGGAGAGSGPGSGSGAK